MDQTVINPSMKLVRVSYGLAFTAVVLCVMYYNNNERLREMPAWIPMLSLLLLIFPMKSHVRRRLTRLIVQPDKLIYESGMFHKMQQVVRLSKVQAVRIDRTIGQRLLGVGTITVDLMGEEKRIRMPCVDQPEYVAKIILDAAGKDENKGGRK
jgi:membrane protein YdbS with pleckstrin-like domain